MLSARTVCPFVLALTVGCQSADKQEAPATPPAAAQQAAPAKTDPDCVGPITAGPAQTLTIGETTWELAGSTLTQKSPGKSDTLIIGALTDIKEDSKENVENLRTFTKWFKDQKVDLIINNGDTGETQAQIENALGILAEVGVPVLTIIGNREGRKVHKAALASLRQKHPHVFNLVEVRRVDTSVVDFVSLPGYHNPNYIHAEDGCLYTPEDAATVATLARSSNSPVFVISHGPPHQEGPNGLDRTSEGDNVGDPALAKIIAEQHIPFGLFGNIHEAGGRATDLAGKTLVPQKTFVSALYVHPGPADAVRWVMNDKTESLGMAAIVTVKGNQASYEVKRVEDPQKKVAKAGKKK